MHDLLGFCAIFRGLHDAAHATRVKFTRAREFAALKQRDEQSSMVFDH